MTLYQKNNVSKLSRICGIYRLLLKGQVIYVGQSVNIGRRIRVHLKEKVIVFDAIAISECFERELPAMEAIAKRSHGITTSDTMGFVKEAMVSKKKEDKNSGDSVCENCNDLYVKKVMHAKFCSSKCRLEHHLKKREAAGLYVGQFYKSLLSLSQ